MSDFLVAEIVFRYDAAAAAQTDLAFRDAVGGRDWTLNDCTLDGAIVSETTRLTAAYRLTAPGLGSGGATPAFPGGDTTFEIWVRPGPLSEAHQVVFETGGGQNGSSFLITETAVRFLNSNQDVRHFDMTVSLAGVDTSDFIQCVAALDAASGSVDLFVRGAAGGAVTTSALGTVGRGNNGASLFSWGASLASLGGGHNGLGGRTEAAGVSPAGLTQFQGEIALLNIYDSALTAAEVDAAFSLVQGRLPTIELFTASPAAIEAGQAITLSWSVADSTQIFLEPGVGDVTTETIDGRGSLQLTPATTTVYTLIATDGRVERHARAQVVVDGEILPAAITEFMADNEDTLVDGDGESSDWVEFHNPNLFPIDLVGHFVTDSVDVLQDWSFPSFEIEGNGYAVVFASGRDADESGTDAGGFLHLPFGLNSAGEYLALVASDGSTVLSEYSPQYPEQFADVSFGIDANGAFGYFPSPTPGAPNLESVLGFVEEPAFSVERGFYDTEFQVTLTTPTEGASIRYTTDGSAPTADVEDVDGLGTLYDGPISIPTTATLRAMAYAAEHQPSRVVTHTYVFLEDVVQQPNDPSGFPAVWAGVRADYEMDPDVVGEQNLFEDRYRETVVDDLLSLPTMSIVMDREELFGASGIYQNPQSEGVAWERAASVEYFFPDRAADGFQVNCGIRIQGGSSRSPNYPKHSLRLLFKRLYGPGKLRYRLFADEPEGENATDEFDTITLRAGFNNSWTHWHWFQNPRAQYIRDQWVRDSQLAMGWPSPHGRYVHLYLNGLYWGIYNPCERPTAPFMAAYYGGSRDDYDTQNVVEAKEGNLQAWNTMQSLANAGVATPAAYAQIREYLDVENLADYMMLNFFVGNDDWDGHNWYAGRRREPGAGYQFFCWDSELVISRHAFPPPQPDFDVILNRDRTGLSVANRPSRLYTRLRDNAEFRLLFADRVQQHFFNDGALTTPNVLARWDARHEQVWRALVPESARWGDYRRDVHQHQNYTPEQYDLFHRDEHYEAHRDWLINTYFPERRDIVLNQFRQRGLWPTLVAPRFSQHGGRIEPGFELEIEAAAGTAFYTLDGSDPRRVGGEVGPTAELYGGPLTLAETTVVQARCREGASWSPLVSARFSIGRPVEPGDVVVATLHYRPLPPGDDEIAAGYRRRSDFEFVEILNVGTDTLDLAGARFVNGIDYRFDPSIHSEIAPGESVFVAHEREAFELRFGAGLSLADGQYEGELSDDGERLTLLGADRRTLVDFVYNDVAPWPEGADGDGCALHLIDPGSQPDPNQPANWRTGPPAGALRPGCDADCNGNGVADRFDIIDGASRDLDGNWVPDECEGGFRRADVNADQERNLTDTVFLLNFLFLGGDAPACLSAGDTDDDGGVNLTDAIYLLNYLFLGGSVVGEPFDECGADPTPDALTCESFSPCLAP